MRPRPSKSIGPACRSRRPATIDPLEPRQLLSAAAVKFENLNVNFQSSDATVPAGFRADGGVSYGRRSNGYTYGWSDDLTDAAYNRNLSRSPGEEFDTGIATQAHGANAAWQLAVLDGTYRVTVVAGDPWIQPSMLGYDI